MISPGDKSKFSAVFISKIFSSNRPVHLLRSENFTQLQADLEVKNRLVTQLESEKTQMYQKVDSRSMVQ